MSSKLTRRVTLPPSRMKSSRERINLLTYRMALAQPTATVPLLQPTPHHTDSVSNAADALSNFRSMSRSITSADGAGGGGGAGCSPATHQSSADEGSHPPDFSRRWVRDADELCVASISRSQSINRINCYVASYKFDDPLWRPFLLPEVHVIPRSTADTGLESGDTPEPASPTMKNGYDVHIDYSKLVNLELISRHANYALRHLVQKGHAMYFVNYAQHSILQMRGLVECTYITCSYGIKGERLRTYLTHVGPLDVRDVMEVDPKTGQVHFHVNKPGVARGVVAVSQVEGYGTWFQRKPMLWQRTRRIGALQSQIGAFEYQLCSPESVGRLREYEISLLQPHLRFHGSGGAEAVGMIASSQVAQNNKLYLGEFEAPAIAALDAVHQLAHQVAVHEKLLKPSASVAGASTSTPADGVEELRQMAAMDRLLPVSWITRTPPPYVPLEADLPFKLQLSKPAVFTPVSSSKKDSPVTHEPHFPTGGTVGTPFIKGVPLSLMEYIMHQGVDHYVFDDAPSARPMKWWNQVSNMPYNGYLYFMRSSLLDSAEAAEAMENPLAPPQQSSRRSGGAARRLKRKKLRRASEPSAGVVPTEAYAETQEVDEHPAADKKAASLSASDAVGRDPLHLLVPPGPRAMRRMAKLNARAATSPVNAVAVMARRRLRRKKQRDSSRQPTSP